ncbi:hypothetical protein LYZ37_07490 [Vibrio tubiashii]|uniref:hypothetical protein n=1 Tax=Vibrio tubiashii TaxID=29498 RepID=UPI00234F41DA|nr:hypothetical protein [Vibrio tubiashii]WCP68561.1 hypothetical protein LYZ37_07490 [Vibrio tubiashii]
MSKYYSESPLVYPSDSDVSNTRSAKHENHLDYFYGDFWCVYEDRENKCYLEFDKGHFGVDLTTVLISRSEYKELISSETSIEVVLARYRQ